MKTLLTEGTYIIPDGCTIKREGMEVKVYHKQIQAVTDNRCRDCKFFLKKGHASKFAGRWTPVCTLKPKRGFVAGDGLAVYYHVDYLSKVCSKFVKNDAV